MDRRWRLIIFVAVLAVPIFGAEAASADPLISVSETANLLDYDTVTIEGTGFAPDVTIGICEAIDDGTPDASDCGAGTRLITSDGSGSFNETIDVRRTFTTASGIAADCSDPASSCAVAAAELNDIPGTVRSVPVSFATPPSPPSTPGAIVLQGAQPFAAGQAVTLDGSGFRSGAAIVLLQCPATAVDARGCVGRQYETAAADGSFSATYPVSESAPVNCGAPGQCTMVAAERVDVAGTLVSAPVQVLPAQQANPDVQFKRRSDGTIFFDNVYDIDVEYRGHPIDAGGRWVFTVPIQNDFSEPTSIRLQADNERPGFRIRYFVGYTEITDEVAGSDGYVFANMAPGEARLIAVQFEADSGVPSGTRVLAQLSFTRTTVPIGFDGLNLSVLVR